jgi:hypothetical protein
MKKYPKIYVCYATFLDCLGSLKILRKLPKANKIYFLSSTVQC